MSFPPFFSPTSAEWGYDSPSKSGSKKEIVMVSDLHPGLSLTSTTSLIQVMYITMERDRRKKVDWLWKQPGMSPFLCTVLKRIKLQIKNLRKTALEILTAWRLNNTPTKASSCFPNSWTPTDKNPEEYARPCTSTCAYALPLHGIMIDYKHHIPCYPDYTHG